MEVNWSKREQNEGIGGAETNRTVPSYTGTERLLTRAWIAKIAGVWKVAEARFRDEKPEINIPNTSF